MQGFGTVNAVRLNNGGSWLKRSLCLEVKTKMFDGDRSPPSSLTLTLLLSKPISRHQSYLLSQ